MGIGVAAAAAEAAAGATRQRHSGIFPSQKIKEMLEGGEIRPSDDAILTTIEESQIQPASIDLRLGYYAYPVSTSFLPMAGVKVLDKLRLIDERFEDFKIDLQNGASLEKGTVYVIPLLEQIALKSDVAAFANPKSSTGRLDILTRLIADGATVFDQVEKGYKGQLYVEVAPKSFSVVARTGDKLNQLRFRRTRGEQAEGIYADEWKKLIEEGQIVSDADSSDEKRLLLGDKRGDLPFTVDLKGAGQGSVIGWRARKHAGRVDLARRDYEARDFWEPIHANKNNSLILDPNEFYILMTKEAIAVPPDYAAEMLPYDTRAGEFRVHYAGFFDPGFGWDMETKRAGSSRGVLEVRSHEVPFLLEHGQIVGWLRYERMVAAPDMLYGQDIQSNYQGQSLKLAKQFKPVS